MNNKRRDARITREGEAALEYQSGNGTKRQGEEGDFIAPNNPASC